jgi:hypothetical protein
VAAVENSITAIAEVRMRFDQNGFHHLRVIFSSFHAKSFTATLLGSGSVSANYASSVGAFNKQSNSGYRPIQISHVARARNFSCL